jgi:ferrous iron transport protein A
MKLAEAKADTNALIKRIDGDAHFKSRITAIGVTEDIPVQIVKNDRKMPVLIFCRETLIALDRADAGKIEVAEI